MRNKRGSLILFFLVLIFGFLYTISQPPAGIGAPLNERSFIRDNGDGSFTLTVYSPLSGDPDSASYFSGAGDGNVNAAESTWNAVHDDIVGWGAYPTETTFAATVQNESSVFGIVRAFIPFDCTALPDDCTITAATISLYSTYHQFDDNDGDDWVNIIGETTQADPTTVADVDFDQCGAIDNPTEGATRIDLSSGITDDAYNVFTLNATGRGWIKKSGTGANAYSRFGVREGHDCIDSAITGTDVYNFVVFASSEATGTATDPKIDITYTPAGGPAYVPKVILIK